MKNTNGNDNNRYKKREELRLRNQALTQRRYRERLKNKGFRQLNVLVAENIYDRVYEFLRQEPGVIAEALDRWELDQIKPEAKEPINIEKNTNREPDTSIEDDLHYTGNFASRLKIVKQKYLVVNGNKVSATEEQITKARDYIEELRKLIIETQNLSQQKAGIKLMDHGYFTFNKMGERIAPTTRSIEMMRLKLITSPDTNV